MPEQWAELQRLLPMRDRSVLHKVSTFRPMRHRMVAVWICSPARTCTNFFSVQGDFIWNRNQLRLNSSSSATTGFYQEDRSSSQEAGIFSFLLYFRRRSSWIRPYLAVGTGVAHLSSTTELVVGSGGATSPPPREFSSIGPVLRTHVGIDLRLVRKLGFRYSFSETIGHNEISHNLSPPGPHGLANFQNLFGFVVRF